MSVSRNESWWRVLIKYCHSLRKGAGNLVVFIGPDGSGKSLLSRRVAAALGENGAWIPMQRGQDWWRDVNSDFLDLNLSLRRSMSSRPPGVRRKVVAAATHSLEYLEQHVRLARVLARLERTDILFTDSYAWGSLLRWHSGSASVPYWWTSACAAAFPNPALVILCAGDPRTIFDRKPDMAPDEIERTISWYRDYLTRRKLRFVEFDTTVEGPDESVQRLMSLLASEFG